MERFKKGIYTVVSALFWLVAATSCAEQDAGQGGVYFGDKETMAVNLRSGGGTANSDEEIKTVRCIVFTTGDKLVSNKLFTIDAGTDPCVITAEMAVGLNNVYIVCNETPEMGIELEKVSAPGHIKIIRFTPPDGGIVNPVPMFSQLSGAQVSKNAAGIPSITVGGTTSQALTITATRIVARLGMTVIKNIPSGEVDFSIAKLSYRLYRLPKYSLLADGGFYPQGEGWGPEIEVLGEGTIEAGSNGDFTVSDGECSVPSGLDAIYFPVTYIPEHKLQSSENPDYCTYMLIEAECLTESSSMPIRTIYRLNLGKMPPADLNIERNVNYQIYATIRGMGATGFYAEIVPVEEYDLPITWKPFEGYAIVGERVSDYGVNANIWNSYSQYSGILKIVKDSKYNDACFRYGSVVALSSTATAGAFNAASDVVWIPDVTKNTTPVSSWDDVGYMTSGDVSGDAHTLENIKLGKGDPCRLVGLSESEIASGTIDNKLWRMPTMPEMQWLVTAQNYTFDTRGYYSFSYLLTPFNGYRSETGLMVPADATAGHYWSATGASSFAFGQNNTSTLATDDPKKAYAVRCIRTDIPTSLFDASGFMPSYFGGTHEIMISPNSVITPHWRMELENQADAAYVSLAKSEGSSKETNKVTVQPLANPYAAQKYLVKVNGYGLDGAVHTRTAVINQRPLIHEVATSWTSLPELGMAEGYYRIPQSGAELEFRITVTPEPYAAYYPDFDNMLWRVECKYYTDKLNIEYGSSAVRNGVSKITIKPDTWGHILGLEFKMVPVDKYPPYECESTVLIQEKE